MQFNNKQIEEFKTILLDSLVFFQDFCNQNHLRYFLCGGTLLGAVRHHGFIPWDDDIDVFMPREDYDRFGDLMRKTQNPDYEYIDIHTSNYYLPFAKLSHKHSTILEARGLQCVYGVYIDIFPLDYTNDTNEEFAKKKSRFDKLSSWLVLGSVHHPIQELLLDLTTFNLKKFVWHIFQKSFLSCCKPIIINKLCKIMTPQPSGKALVCYSGGYKSKEYFSPDLFSEKVDGMFEGVRVSMPVGFHRYLSQLYGDYMQLPPIEKRQSHHSHYYCNLERRVSVEEIKEIMKSNE